MKKLIALLLALLMILTLSACKGEESDKKSDANTIDSYAQKGEIPEIPVKLGTQIDKVKEIFPADTGDMDEDKVLLSEIAGETAVCLVTLNSSFYYEKAYIDNGVSVIAVTNGNAFGLELCNVTTKSDVTAKLKAEYTEGVATEDQQYFLPGVSENCKFMSTTFDKIRLDFFFVDDYLVAVTLTNTEYWTD